MFNYNTPKWNIRISARALSIFCTTVFVLGLIPMLIIGFYDWPCTDDFSMALQTRQSFETYGNFFLAVIAALKKSYWIYTNYEGYFFSIILTCLCPSCFGEGWYVLTPFIVLAMLIFGVSYFFDALFVRVWKLDKDLTNVMRMLTLIMMIQCINGRGVRVEAFYWYSGAINYTFTFGMAFFWLGLLFRSVYDESQSSRKRKLIWACVWGFFLGGANFLTALELAICSVLILFIFIMVKRGAFELEGNADNSRSFGLIWLPTLFNIIGFLCSCFAPGNSGRTSMVAEHYGPVKSVLLSLFSTFYILLNEMMRWEVLVCLVILIPISWKMGERLGHRLKHPIMFGLFAYLLVSSNFTPPYYATANFEGGRLRALAFMEFVFMMVLVVFYYTVWARQYFDERTNSGVDMNQTPGNKVILSAASSMIIVVCMVFIAGGSCLCVVPEHTYYSATSAIGDLVSGNAAVYRQENLDRLTVLQDDSIKVAELKEHTKFPELLFFTDVTFDQDEWVNTATARYYRKDAVYLIH